MKNPTYCFLIIFGLVVLFSTSCNKKPKKEHDGKPWKGVIQKIPGKIQYEFYDEGGEGVAYHDQDSINNGSGTLNPPDGTFLNEYRKDEGVDISYIKFQDPAIDNSPYNLVEPEKNQFYVGWTNPGEWMNFTVNVKIPGKYQVGIMYGADQDGEISLSVNHEESKDTLRIPSTYNADDLEEWRQQHHWNYLDSIGQITLKEGIQTITLNTLESGQMNFDYINFQLVR